MRIGWIGAFFDLRFLGEGGSSNVTDRAGLLVVEELIVEHTSSSFRCLRLIEVEGIDHRRCSFIVGLSWDTRPRGLRMTGKRRGRLRNEGGKGAVTVELIV